MPGQDIARQWFIPGDGIDRHVITADIQRYLGNDATVRPGRGTGSNEGVDGYWIRAYRNLTSAMIADLRADSQRWRQEQRATGTKESYVGSRTYEQGSASKQQRHNAESPALDGGYRAPPASRGGRGEVDAMQIDPPSLPSDRTDRGRYGREPPQPSRGGYAPETGAYPPTSGRERYPESTRPAFPQDQPMAEAYGRGQPSQPYGGQDPRYGGAYPPGHDGAPPGYVRQGDFYVPITSGYGNPSIMAPSRPEPQAYPSNPYGQPSEPFRETRGARGDPRDPRDPRYGQPDYSEASRYYPSPATTAASVGNREPIASPPVASAYGSIPYDQHGRPVQQPQTFYGAPESGYPPTRDPGYGRGPAPPSANDRDRDARRRRLH